MRLMKEEMLESLHDVAFMREKVQIEKRKNRKQEHIIRALKGQHDKLRVTMQAKDLEIKQLQVKLLRFENFTSNKSKSDGFDGDESHREEVLDGVMITQRG